MAISPIFRSVIRGFSRLHVDLYRALGGRGPGNRNTLLLVTNGRKTGREVTTPLLYVEDKEKLYVVASFGGSDTPPRWYLNLTANPEVAVEVRGRTGRYRARSLTVEEAAPVWPKLLELFPPYAGYQKKTRRLIPIVELAPV